MNTRNAKIFSIISLVLVSFATIIGIISLTIFVSELSAYLASIDITNYDPSTTVEFSMSLRTKLEVYLKISKFLGMPTFISVLLTAIEANKLKENRTPLILIIIGIFISPVAIAGIILLLVEIKKIEKNSPPTTDDNYTNHVEL